MSGSGQNDRMIALGDGLGLYQRGMEWHLREQDASPEAESRYIWDHRPTDRELAAVYRPDPIDPARVQVGDVFFPKNNARVRRVIEIVGEDAVWVAYDREGETWCDRGQCSLYHLARVWAYRRASPEENARYNPPEPRAGRERAKDSSPDNVKLRPCPFCGADTIWLQNTDEHRIHHNGRCAAKLVYYACVACKAYGPDMPSAERAATAWNTRAEQPLQNRIDARYLPPVMLSETHSYERGCMRAVLAGAAWSKRLGEADGKHIVTKFWRQGGVGQLQYCCLRYTGGSMWVLEPWFDAVNDVPMDADPLFPEVAHARA